MWEVLRKIILLSMFFIFSFIIFGCGNRDENYNLSNEDRIILRLAETQPPNYPSSRAVQLFARLVEQKSGGRIKVEVYDSGKLGAETNVIEQVQFGGIDLARISLASLAKYSSKAKIVTFPYLFRSSDHMWEVLSGPVGEDIKESLLKEKITCLAWYEGGARAFYSSNRFIRNINDLKGLKLSVQPSPLIMDLYSYIGVSLVPTQFNDLYSALQTGNIDGVEGNVIAYYTSKHYEVAPYLTYDEHMRIPEVIIGSRITMLQLSKDDQAIIEQAAKESAVMQRQTWFQMEQEVFKELNNMGINIIYMDEKSRKTFLATVKSFYSNLKKDELEAIMEISSSDLGTPVGTKDE